MRGSGGVGEREECKKAVASRCVTAAWAGVCRRQAEGLQAGGAVEDIGGLAHRVKGVRERDSPKR